jgi:hypothetical protein
MIDYIKIERLKSSVKQNPLLESKWILTSNEDAVFLKEEAIYNKLKFETKKARLSDKYYSKVSGSIHYYFNGGLHNYNDFSFSNIVEVVDEISNLFEIDNRNELNNLEFGVNIKLPFEPKLILDNLVTHKGKGFSHVTKHGQNYHQCQHSQFIIKMYEKGLQFGLSDNILRFEIKVIKMQYLHRNGIRIKSLKCLQNKTVYEPLGRLLSKVFDEIMIDCEGLDMSLLTEAEMVTYLLATKTSTWKKENRPDSKSQKQLQRLSEKYYKLVNQQIKGTSIKTLVARLIEEKWSELSEIYHTKKNYIQDIIVHYLPFKYNVSFGHKPFIHYQRPSIYNRDF